MVSFFVVPHGVKFSGADPFMTPGGLEQIAGLKPHLPSEISQVWRGEGRRHGQVAMALDLIPTHYSGLWGTASSVERRESGPVTVLPDGSVYPFKPADAGVFRASLLQLINSEVVDGAIVCAGRECLMALTGKMAQELKTGLYKVIVSGESVSHEIVALALGDF